MTSPETSYDGWWRNFLAASGNFEKTNEAPVEHVTETSLLEARSGGTVIDKHRKVTVRYKGSMKIWANNNMMIMESFVF
jgi:hypothetical protein